MRRLSDRSYSHFLDQVMRSGQSFGPRRNGRHAKAASVPLACPGDRDDHPGNLGAASMTELDAIRATMRANYLPPEEEALQRLVAQAGLSIEERLRIAARAADLV